MYVIVTGIFVGFILWKGRLGLPYYYCSPRTPILRSPMADLTDISDPVYPLHPGEQNSSKYFETKRTNIFTTTFLQRMRCPAPRTRDLRPRPHSPWRTDTNNNNQQRTN